MMATIFQDAVVAQSRHMRQPLSQAAQSFPYGSPTIPHADRMLYRMATITADILQQLQLFWTTQSPEAALHRLAVASPLPKLVRKAATAGGCPR